MSVDRHGKKRPELLAPAGEPDALYGAFSAGADAVYLGAEKFSARAFARNFSNEELIKALDHAHLFGKKIYLACNILMRTAEIDDMYDVIDPLYEHGLDGVIVQDTGVLMCLKHRYPLLELHASTQMSINSVGGVKWLKEHGVSRVVPGRELSLEEIRQIKESGIEVECFVHGAMCYSYSGKCLLSSLAGGRSGNRGRCAGPCRKTYSIDGSERAYYLSMKDMMALGNIGSLIDAGVDSFKIEGRMKAPEYAAGVSAIYRKYIDRYMAGKKIALDADDISELKELYMRSERQEGYLFKHNGRDMISIASPAYSKVSEERKNRIRDKYISVKRKASVDAHISIKEGNEASLELKCGDTDIAVRGALCEKALNRALSDEDIRKQMLKSGDTDFIIDELDIENDGASFMPVSSLNALRRDGFALLNDHLQKRRVISGDKLSLGKERRNGHASALKIGICGDADIKIFSGFENIDGFILDISAFTACPARYIDDAGGRKLYLRLPSVIRQKDLKKLGALIAEASVYPLDGIYCGCIDGIKLINEHARGTKVFGDQGLYVFNPYSEMLMLDELSAYTVSHEFSASDIKSAIRKDAAELIVYGRIPVMYSANCIIKTAKKCDTGAGWSTLEDEMGHSFPVRPVHEFCYNIMYNCVPASLHREACRIFNDLGLNAIRLEFTDESKDEQIKITDAFCRMIQGEDIRFPIEEKRLSRGHYKRGVE
ncbi:MAG: U32 family peptidase [Lachnospiraceae bacterium]|nr:U32 family peptidase [Lachnospiraceae bacterium]